MEKRKKFYTIDEIDGVTSITGPHRKELKEIGERNVRVFRDLSKEQLKNVSDKMLGGILENIELEEEWTLTIEVFPNVKIHIIYYFYGDEFETNEIDQLKFLFSEERVCWIPGEDLASFIDIMMNYVERMINNKEPFEPGKGEQSEMLKNAIQIRAPSFYFIEYEDLYPLTEFLGGKLINKKPWTIHKEIFPGIIIEINFTKNQELIPIIKGKNSKFLENYEKDLLRILTINHILRYIIIKYDERDLPEICKIMFARGYLKKK